MTKSPSEQDGRRYCVLPFRCVDDDTMHMTTLRVLMAICVHTNGHGIAWPSRIALAQFVKRHPDTISKHVQRLIKAEYIRKLKPKAYPITRKTGHHWTTNRYQVLFEGAKTKLPSKEQFWAPRAKVAKDEPMPTTARLNDQGVRGTNNQSHAIAQAFAAGVARASGQHRIADQNLSMAAKLDAANVSAERILDVTTQMTREALEAGRSAPLTLEQVAAWAGLD